MKGWCRIKQGGLFKKNKIRIDIDVAELFEITGIKKWMTAQDAMRSLVTDMSKRIAYKLSELEYADNVRRTSGKANR